MTNVGYPKPVNTEYIVSIQFNSNKFIRTSAAPNIFTKITEICTIIICNTLTNYVVEKYFLILR